MQKQFQAQRPRFIPVILENGMKASVQQGSISDWTTHHGKTAAGVTVNSLLSKQIGNSVLLAKSPDSLAFSVAKDDLEVFAVQHLNSLGYNVSAPAQK